VDLQNTADTNYFNIHLDNGWILLYNSKAWSQKWVIWAREYDAAEAKPRIYSDKLHQLKLAKRVALTYSAMFLPMIILYSYIIGLNIKLSASIKPDTMQLVNMYLFGLLIALFSTHVARTWLYYSRLRKHH